MLTRRSFLLSPALVPAAAQAADSFPSRPITWVVPYPAGGFGDAISRLLGASLGADLGQTVIIDNRPGAGGQIGANFVKQQPADGYTLLYGDIGPFAMNAALYPRLSYDTLKDFAPLTRLVTAPLVLVVPQASPIRTLDDLLKAAKSDKGVMYGSYGMGSQPHIWIEMFRREAGANFHHVPYKGATPAMQDLMGGQIATMLDVSANSLPHVREKRLRALALVGSDRRLESLPEVPTIAELGYPKLNAPGWAGVVVRAETPAPVVERLHAGLLTALRSDELKKRYAEFGIVAAPQSPAEFAQTIRSETERWGRAIRAAGVVLE